MVALLFRMAQFHFAIDWRYKKKQEDFDVWHWILIRKKNVAKNQGLLSRKPIKAQSNEVSKWQKWKGCQTQLLIWVSESRGEIYLSVLCSPCAAVIFPQLLFQCVSVIKRVTRSLPGRAAWSVMVKLSVDPADPRPPWSRKWSLCLKHTHPAICPGFQYTQLHPASHPHTAAPVKPATTGRINERIGHTHTHTHAHGTWIKDLAAALHTEP